MQNGPFEEFLFRGAIQTRLTMLLGPVWGIGLASLVFGVWHLGLGYTMMGSQSFADGFANSMLWLGTLGVGFGFIYWRTRNLVSSSILHVVANSIG